LGLDEASQSILRDSGWGRAIEAGSKRRLSLAWPPRVEQQLPQGKRSHRPACVFSAALDRELQRLNSAC
jgi:hypothetical protein